MARHSRWAFPRSKEPLSTQHPRPLFVRNLGAGPLLEIFLVAAVAAVLSVRFILSATGYPQLGGGGLHIAHLLWGGALMLGAMLLALTYLGRRIARTVSVVGGLGFGLFIDELGKFVTSSNNYFFRPAIAIMYIVFVLLFLWWRNLERHRTWGEETYLANALLLLQEAAVHDLDPTEKHHLLRWLRLSGRAGSGLLGDTGRGVASRPPDVRQRSTLARFWRAGKNRIGSVLRSHWMARAVVVVLILRNIGAVLTMTALIAGLVHGVGNLTQDELPLALAGTISAAFVLIGAGYLIAGSRLRAYRWFKRSVLASIILTDLFLFYFVQLGALSNLAVDLILLISLEAMIDSEHRREAEALAEP